MPRTTRASLAAQSDGVENAPQQLSSPPTTPKSNGRTKHKNTTPAVKKEAPQTPVQASLKGKKRGRQTVKQEDGDVNELPHNLGTALPTPGEDEGRSKKRPRRSPKTEDEESLKEEGKEDVPVKEEPNDTPKKSPKKKDNYGLTPGKTPYPDYPHPTPEECKEVVRLLEKVHGKVIVPKAIPTPSLEVAGCGEVPSVLDALVRTRLSANTTNKNSSTAFQGLVARFGTLSSGIGKGSVNWDAVRVAPQRDVFKAIERGGLADRKSKDIQAILQMAYEENQARGTALSDPKQNNPEGAENEGADEKAAEIDKADQNIISLDHLHLLDTAAAIEKMLTYPGIGPKTASCVALFCLQRPSFAVDTHVFRLCKYLGWVPASTKKGQPKVDRNTTYSHCDVRIPDEFKYPLHQLLIKHGKTCPRCRAVTGQTSAAWGQGCPIEHLVKRHGAKKGGVSVVQRQKAKEAAKEGEDEEEDDDEWAEGED